MNKRSILVYKKKYIKELMRESIQNSTGQCKEIENLENVNNEKMYAKVREMCDLYKNHMSDGIMSKEENILIESHEKLEIWFELFNDDGRMEIPKEVNLIN